MFLTDWFLALGVACLALGLWGLKDKVRK